MLNQMSENSLAPRSLIGYSGDFLTPLILERSRYWLLGVFPILVYAVKERGLGLNTAWSLSGIVYTALVFVGVVVIWWMEPDYYAPPPGLQQYVRVVFVLLLDVVGVIAVRRMLRRYPA